MDNKQVTAEWIAKQRQISEIVNMTYEDAPGSVVPLLKQLEKSQTAALDALEASMQREAEKDATIARLTAENSGCANHEREIIDCVRYADAADVVPVVHGEWGADGKCTHCGSPMPVKDCTGDEMGKNDSQYCFRCGSRMDGGEHHAD